MPEQPQNENANPGGVPTAEPAEAKNAEAQAAATDAEVIQITSRATPPAPKGLAPYTPFPTMAQGIASIDPSLLGGPAGAHAIPAIVTMLDQQLRKADERSDAGRDQVEKLREELSACKVDRGRLEERLAAALEGRTYSTALVGFGGALIGLAPYAWEKLPGSFGTALLVMGVGLILLAIRWTSIRWPWSRRR